MGIATNSLPVITLEKNTQAEANWLAVPDFPRPSLLPRAPRLEGEILNPVSRGAIHLRPQPTTLRHQY